MKGHRKQATDRVQGFKYKRKASTQVKHMRAIRKGRRTQAGSVTTCKIKQEITNITSNKRRKTN